MGVVLGALGAQTDTQVCLLGDGVTLLSRASLVQGRVLSWPPLPPFWTVTALVGQGVLPSSLVHFSHLLLGPLPALSPPSFLSVGFWIFLSGPPAPISSLAGLLGDFPPPPVWHSGHLPSVLPFSTHIPQRHQTLCCNVCDFAPRFSQECPSLCPPQIGSYHSLRCHLHLLPEPLDLWTRGGELLPRVPEPPDPL